MAGLVSHQEDVSLRLRALYFIVLDDELFLEDLDGV